jgi:hypothetical protein
VRLADMRSRYDSGATIAAEFLTTAGDLGP